MEKINKEARDNLMTIDEGNFIKVADKLINNKSDEVRKAVIKYVSKEKLIKRALVEYSFDVANSILERLEKEGITEDEANILLNVEYYKIRVLAVKYATRANLIKRALEEVDDNVLESILKRQKITKKEANILLNAVSCKIRVLAVEYAYKKELARRTLLEKDSEVIEKILARLKKEEITKKEAEILLNAKSRQIRSLAVKCASMEKLAERTLVEENADVLKNVLERLGKEGITEKEANILLEAKDCKIRALAVRYASKVNLIKRALTENIKNIVEAILERLIKEGITKEDASELLKSKNSLISSIAEEIYNELDF